MTKAFINSLYQKTPHREGSTAGERDRFGVELLHWNYEPETQQTTADNPTRPRVAANRRAGAETDIPTTELVAFAELDVYTLGTPFHHLPGPARGGIAVAGRPRQVVGVSRIARGSPMERVSDYLIVGGGMTADAAVRGIRESDPTGSITVLSAERYPPYDRPPLSKKLWAGKPLETIWRKTETAGVDLRLETRALDGDASAHTVRDSRGDVHVYRKLLLATGGTPRHLPFPDDDVIYFRTLEDYQRARALCDRQAEFIVIGGGFIGSELAAALSGNGCAVSMVFPESGIGARIYPPALSAFLNDYYRDRGVRLFPSESVTDLQHSGASIIVTTGDGAAVRADAAIAGIGIVPETGLAEALGLEVDNGIRVDAFLRTSHPDIYAAGDVANVYSPTLDMRRRVEHEDNANAMGTVAGRNMAGRSDRYEHLPYFYSDLFDLGYEAVGEFGGAMEIVEDWHEPFRKGVVYYLRDGRVRGVLLWNVWDRVPAARALIAARETLDPHALRGRITA